MIIIPGFTDSSKTPGAVGQNVYGSGPSNLGANPMKLLVVGHCNSTGTAVPDVTVQQCISTEDVEAFAGPRSELANMGYAALQVPGVTLYLAAVTEPGAAAAATQTATIAGAWTTGGQISFDFGGVVYQVAVASTDTVTNVAANVSATLGRDAHLYCTAAAVVGVVTLTVSSKGVRGNQHIVHVDLTAAPTGLTCVLAGGTALADGGVPFSGGSGTDDVTALLATLLNQTFERQAWAQADAVNGALINNQMNTKAGPLVGRLEDAVFAANGLQSAAQTIAQGTMNSQLCEYLWMAFHRAHPSRVAACRAAVRSVTEGANPNPNYDAIYDASILPGIPGHFRSSDVPGRATTDSCLNNSLTPLTTRNGQCRVVRAITTHSLNGAAPDYRTLDVGQAIVPQRIRQELVSFWSDFYAVNNPYAGPDAAPENPVPVDGKATPLLWNNEVEAQLRKFERANWITNVDNNKPQSEWNVAAKRIMTVVPTQVTDLNHQQGIKVVQKQAS